MIHLGQAYFYTIITILLKDTTQYVFVHYFGRYFCLSPSHMYSLQIINIAIHNIKPIII